jgi:hypothetical protein
MTGLAIDERKGVPAVSQLTWVWALVLTLFSSGLFALGMALHISYWVRSKRKQGLAFYAYLILTVGLIFEFLPLRVVSNSLVIGVVDTAWGVLWIGAAFLLRRELMSYYATPEGGVLEISPWWTGLFSIYYLNYCLWVVRDSA